MQEPGASNFPAENFRSQECQMNKPIKKAIIIHQGALGDLINTVPAIRAIKENAGLLIGIGSERLQLLEYAGILDQALSSESISFHTLFSENFQPARILEEIFSGTELAVSWLGRNSEVYQKNLARLAGKAEIFQEPFPPAPGSEPISKILARPVQKAGIEVSDFIPRLKLPESAKETALSIVGDKPFIAIHPGSGSSKKAMPAAKLFRILELLAEIMPRQKIAIITGEVEKQMVFELVKKCPEKLRPIAQLVKDLPLLKLADLLSQAQLYLGMDSGPTHLAASLGIKTVAVFGPTDPLVWAPPQGNVKVAAGRFPCAPCTDETRRDCPEPRCMAAVSEEEIIELIKT